MHAPISASIALIMGTATLSRLLFPHFTGSHVSFSFSPTNTPFALISLSLSHSYALSYLYRKMKMPTDKENQAISRNAVSHPTTPSTKSKSHRKLRSASSNNTNQKQPPSMETLLLSPPGSSKLLRKHFATKMHLQEQQQQSRWLLEQGPVRLATASPLQQQQQQQSETAMTVDAALNTSADDQSLAGFMLEPVSARKDCTNPVAMILWHSGTHDQQERNSHHGRHSLSLSPLPCSNQAPVTDVTRPVPNRPPHASHQQQQEAQQQAFWYQHHVQQQQQFYQQHQQQQQQQFYQQQQLQQQFLFPQGSN